MARILIVTPAPTGSRQGNRITASRWARLLRFLGHHVQLAEYYCSQRCDCLIALHARKSAPSVRLCVKEGTCPVIVALTGTDLYGDIRTSAAAQRSLSLATRLILLQPRGFLELPSRFRSKARVIFQSVPPISAPRPLQRVFEICVSGHLRSVKDPFRAAMAARRLSPDSRILVTHIGAALSAAMARRAGEEMGRNPRYRWLGEVPHGRARQILARSRALVLSSKLEGGANVLAEAITAKVPALASRISGSLGMLGDDYAGYFSVADTDELAGLMHRCERDEQFYQRLQTQCAERACLFRPERELEAWRALLAEVWR